MIAQPSSLLGAPALAAAPAPICWLGIDVAKDSFDAALHPALRPGEPPALDKLPTRQFSRSRRGVAELFAWAQSVLGADAEPSRPGAPALRVVMESTGSYSSQLAVWMIAECPGSAPAIVNPELTVAHARSLGARNKTDKTDARVIARFGAERSPCPWEQLTPLHQELRDLARERASVVVQLTAQRERAREQTTAKLVARIQARLISQLEKSLKQLDKALDELIKKTPEFASDFAAASSIPGVGRVVFFTVRAELGDLRRFGSSRKLSAFAGLCPRQHSSGSSVRRRTRLCKRGNPEVRRVLYMAAMVAVRQPESPLGRFYARLLKAGKSRMSALMAVARKLLLLMRAVIISGKKYDPDLLNPCGQNAKSCEQIPPGTPQL